MLRCLVVDDDAGKVEQICGVVKQELGDRLVDIVVEGSAYDAGARMRTDQFDLLIIDLNLPKRQGESPVEDAGCKLLRQVGRGSNGLKRPSCVVGLTAFENLLTRNLADFHEQGWALIRYEVGSRTWEETVANQCRQLSEVQRRYSSSPVLQADVCICSALSEPELDAVTTKINGEPMSMPDDSTRYWRGMVEAGGRRCSVVMAAAIEPGVSATATLATRMIDRFHPRVFILTGICAGIRASIGDIVFAESVVNYESGKWMQAEMEFEATFSPEPRYKPASEGMIAAFRQFKVEMNGEILAFPAAFRGCDAPKAPVAHVGPVACGAAVIESTLIVDDLTFQNRKLEALEMEGYGFYVACRAAYPGLEYAMIKSVCDTGRPPKTDQYQEYAAYLSAATCEAFVRHELTAANGLLSRDA